MFSRAQNHAMAAAVAMALALIPSGCLDRELKPLNPCLVSGVVAEIAVTNIDKVDMLFVVDNSGSMREEQDALRQQFPNLIRVMTTGDRDGDGKPEFPPAKDLHLGVVSSDMGLVGIQGVTGCGGIGDDGIMNNVPGPNVAGCQASYPRFLSYAAGVHDPAQTATDFSCIADLGTDGCGFEQQLEAGLKALWPMSYNDPETGAPTSNPIEFLADENGFGQFGHGDVENRGFLRNDVTQGISLIAIIVVSDEEDCSSADTRHFIPKSLLPDGDPLRDQDLNLRCFNNPGNLYVLDRYVNGFKALRPGAEHLVIFGGIVGVPPDLVDQKSLAAVDFSNEVQRDGFYGSILADNRMQEVPDPSLPEGKGNLRASCDTETGRAYPPRRFVEVAQRFGENGIIQSICQRDFGPAMDAIIDVIANKLGPVCLPRKLVRNSDGLVGCDVVWELPPPNLAPTGTPVTCGELDFLLPPDEGRDTVTASGGQVCKVAQLAVLGNQYQGTDGLTNGWYYDDFSAGVTEQCSADAPQRVAFTPDAQPPTGVTVKLECLNEAQSLSENRTDIRSGIEQPSVGDPCDDVVINGTPRMGDAACEVVLNAPSDQWPEGVDRRMFCHPEENVCVVACSTDVDCPAAWVCDDRDATLLSTAGPGRENGSPICVNPTCGDSD